MSHKLPLAILFTTTLASPLWAAHANPWMTEDDEVLMQYHEDNLEQSVDTPLEDAMLGVMTRRATGKTLLDAGSDEGAGRALGHAGGGAQGGGKGGRK